MAPDALHVEKKKKRKKRCTGGKTRCGKRCVDTRVDPANRGRCGRACVAPETCGGGNPGTPGACGCTKTTCAAQGKDCGTIADGRGGTLQCGACDDPDICGGGGMANVCGCLANGELTTVGNCDVCCSKDCCGTDVPGQRVCAGGCG